MVNRAMLTDIALSTERLSIREFKDDEADYEHMYELESIPEVVRYQDWPPRTQDQAREVVAVIIRSQAKEPRTHVELAVVSKLENTFIGRIGTNINLDTNPPQAALWFAFMPQSQGQGYASEAMLAFLELLVSAGIKRFEIECDPRNHGSRKLAERIGFTKVNEVERARESKGEWVGSIEYVRIFK